MGRGELGGCQIWKHEELRAAVFTFQTDVDQNHPGCAAGVGVSHAGDPATAQAQTSEWKQPRGGYRHCRAAGSKSKAARQAFEHSNRYADLSPENEPILWGFLASLTGSEIHLAVEVVRCRVKV